VYALAVWRCVGPAGARWQCQREGGGAVDVRGQCVGVWVRAGRDSAREWCSGYALPVRRRSGCALAGKGAPPHWQGQREGGTHQRRGQ
jgi:hypothetical protein